MEELTALDEQDVAARLFHAQLLITNRRYQEAGGLLEYVMLSLRLAEGLDTARLAGHGGNAAALLRRAAPLEKAGYLTVTEGRVALTGRGFLLSNSIIGALLGK